jgi:hypothetical protein
MSSCFVRKDGYMSDPEVPPEYIVIWATKDGNIEVGGVGNFSEEEFEAMMNIAINKIRLIRIRKEKQQRAGTTIYIPEVPKF